MVGKKSYEDICLYHMLIGRLLYLTNTRKHICFVVHQLSRFLSAPINIHYKAACRVIRYLEVCPGKGLFFPKSSTIQLLGFTYADWVGCVDTRYIIGLCLFLGLSLISWHTKKIKVLYPYPLVKNNR